MQSRVGTNATWNGYYRVPIKADWTGWKTIEISADALKKTEAYGASWADIMKIHFRAEGWGATPVAGTTLYFCLLYTSILPTDKFPSQVKEDFKKQMENSVGIYDYRNQVYAGGQLVALNENDASVQIVESGDVSMAPLNFFEKFLGAAVTQEGDQATVELNGVKVAAVLGNTQYTAGGEGQAFSAVYLSLIHI